MRPAAWPCRDDTDNEIPGWTSCISSHWMPFVPRSETIVTTDFSAISNCYNRCRQSHGPNPARKLRRCGPQQLVSFNIKSGPCAPAKCTKRWIVITWVGFSRTPISSLTMTGSLTLDLFGHSSSNIGTFLVKFRKKNSIKLTTGGDDLKTILNKIFTISPCVWWTLIKLVFDQIS